MEAQGVVSEPPEDWEGGQELVVRVQSVKPLSADVATADQGSARGKILLRTSPGSAYAYGDLLAIRGELTQAGESAAFSYKNYLFHRGITALSQYARVQLLAREQGSPISSAIFRLRERSYLVARQIFPEPESALLRGILLGDESGISAELEPIIRRYRVAYSRPVRLGLPIPPNSNIPAIRPLASTRPRVG